MDLTAQLGLPQTSVSRACARLYAPACIVHLACGIVQLTGHQPRIVFMHLPHLQMSISKQDGTHGFTTVLCVLAAVALGPVAVIRAAPSPMIAKGFGILTSIIFAVVLVNGQFLWPQASGARTYWHQVSVREMCSACVPLHLV